MADMDDIALLREYVENSSESSFAGIVQRHINLVYSAALRSTGNTEDAQDVTQAVFIILARKASGLRPKTILTGWLYETTRFAAMNFLTNKNRRHAREQEAYMQSTSNDAETEATWLQVAPLLENAMSRLTEKDRMLVALRFFENRSMAETAALLGIQEWAARKRAERALDKLRVYFSKRGVNSSTSIIAGAISGNSVQAAPPGLTETISAVALTKGAVASASTLTLVNGALKLMAWIKAQTVIVVGAVLIVATGASFVMVKEVHAQKIIPAAGTGFPQTLDALNAWYAEPPAGQNAATFELQGISAMQIADAQRIPNLPILGNAPPPTLSAPVLPAMKSALAAFLQRNQDALQSFGQGAQYDQSRYPVDFTKYPTYTLPYLNGLRTAAQIEEMAAISDAENNNGPQAADDVLASMGLARSLEAEPILISQLVRAADVALSVAALEQVANRITLSPESLDKLSSAFQTMEAYDAKGEGFDRGIVGEYVFGRALYNNRDWLLQAFSTDAKMTEYLNRTTDLKDEQDYMEATFGELMSARQKTFPNRLEEVKDVIEEHAAEARTRGLLLNAEKWNTIEPVTVREARCLVNLRLGMTAIALEQFRAAHGNQYPSTLAELTPAYLAATPLDPFDGKALRYRTRGAGYILYSVGRDLQDYGGNAGRGNIPFSVFRPPQH